MKVIYLTSEYDCGLDRTMSQDIVQGMADIGMYVSVFSTPAIDTPPEVLLGGHVTLIRERVDRIFGGGIVGLLTRDRLIRNLTKIASKDVSVDMIVVDGYGYNEYAFKKLKKATRAVIVCDMLSTPILRGDSAKPLKEHYQRLKDRQIWHYCDKVIVGSEIERDTLLRVGVATAKIEVIPPWRRPKLSSERMYIAGAVSRQTPPTIRDSVSKYISVLTSVYIKNKETIC